MSKEELLSIEARPTLECRSGTWRLAESAGFVHDRLRVAGVLSSCQLMSCKNDGSAVCGRGNSFLMAIDSLFLLESR